jgi:hypothetical protein
MGSDGETPIGASCRTASQLMPRGRRHVDIACVFTARNATLAVMRMAMVGAVWLLMCGCGNSSGENHLVDTVGSIEYALTDAGCVTYAVSPEAGLASNPCGFCVLDSTCSEGLMCWALPGLDNACAYVGYACEVEMPGNKILTQPMCCGPGDVYLPVCE